MNLRTNHTLNELVQTMTESTSIDAILMKAVAIADEGERLAFVERACAGEPERQRLVERLIENHFLAGTFLERPIGFTALSVDPSEQTGALIGPYRLLEVLGEGGMGTVYVAQQESPVRRQVALKVIKTGMDTHEVVARFEAERQTLALMDHPGIARVLEAGSTSLGRPYFVMELVRGTAITEYCRKHALNLDKRLELFVRVCRALQHAHDRGIIHRDIKPSNVLVLTQDGLAVPKIIDFGIAKAIDQRLTANVINTRFTQLLGTPLYMSPEQAAPFGSDVDQRSDIYSLGVLLYELLTETTPFDAETLRTVGIDRIRQMICEEDPPRPSGQIDRRPATVTLLAGDGAIEPKRLKQIFRRDLDWITMKAIAKLPADRYGTADDFAADIERYLRHEPILARRPSVATRIRKWGRRNPTRVAAMGTFLAATLVALTAGAVSLHFVNRKTEIAEDRVRQLSLEAANAREESHWHRYSSQIATAHREWNLKNREAVWKLLESCPRDQRGWEHNYLYGLLNGNQKVLKGHLLPVTHLTFNSDATRLASVCTGGQLRIWNTQNPDEKPVLLRASGPIVFTPDATGIVCMSAAKAIEVRDCISGERISTLSEPIRTAMKIAISPDAKTIAIAGTDSVLAHLGSITKVFDLTSGRLQFALHENQPRPSSIFWSPAGDRIVGCDMNAIRIWDASNGSELRKIGFQGTGVTCAAFNEDGTKLLAGAGSTLKLVDTQTGGEVRRWMTEGGISDTAWGMEGPCVAGSGHITQYSWDSATQVRQSVYLGNNSTLLSSALSRDGKHFATGTYDGTIRVWSASHAAIRGRDDKEPAILGDSDHATSFAFSRDGKMIVGVGGQGLVCAWDAQTRHRLLSLNHRASNLAVCADGSHFVGSIRGGRLVFFDPNHEASTYESDAFGRAITCIAVNPNGNDLVIGTLDGALKTWDVANRQETDAIENGGSRVSCVAYSPDGKQLAAGTDTGIILLRRESSADVLNLNGHSPGRVLAVTFSPDGKQLASAGDDCNIVVRDLVNLEQGFSLSGHTGGARCLTYHPDGTRLASGGSDGTIRIWSVNRREEVLTLKSDSQSISCLAFSSDGAQLISASQNGPTRFWDASRSMAADLDK